MGTVPSTLRPVFRDRDEFVAGRTLTEATVEALEQSAALIVLCSPVAATRPAVNEEVRLFRTRHPDRPIIPVIIDGQFPDCFPPALRYEFAADGTPTDTPMSLLGADLRENADGRLHGLAKIASGLTGIGTDEFVRRAERERRRSMTRWVAGLASVVVALSGLALWAEVNRRDAVVQRGVAEKQTRTAEEQKSIAERERDQAFVVQSRFLADTANRLTENHDAVSGGLVAIEGLPDPTRGRRRPYVSDPELALYKAFVSAREMTIYGGHTGSVYDGVISPDRSILATTSEDATARLFDISSGRVRAVLRGHKHRVVDAAFTPNGRQVVTASIDGTAKLWDVATGSPLRTFEGHTLDVKKVVIDRSGTRLLTASGDGTARIWSLTDGTTQHVLEGHQSRLWEAEFSPDGMRVVTASGDHTAIIWNAATGAIERQLGGHREQVHGAHFSPDGRLVATRSQDKTVRIVDASSGDLVADLAGHSAFIEVARFSPDGTRVVTADDDGEVRLWSVQDGRLLYRLVGHRRRVTDVQFSPTGDVVATSGYDGTVRIWDAKNGTLRNTLAGHVGDVLSVTFLDEHRLISTSADNSARLWQLPPPNIVELRGHSAKVFSASYSRDGKLIITGSDDRTARVWDAATGLERALLGPNRNSIHAASFSADGLRAFVGDANLVRVWDVTSRAQIDEWVAFPTEDNITPQISHIALSPDGQRIAVAGNLKVAIFDLSTKQKLTTLETKEFLLLDLAYSPNGEFIVTAGFGPFMGDDGKVDMSMAGAARLWDATTGKELRLIDRQAGQVSISFGSGNTETLTVSEHGWVRRRSLQSGAVLASALENGAQTATEAPHGKLIAVSRFQGPTSLRRKLGDGDIAATSPVGSDIWWRPVFDPSGTHFVTVHDDGIARIWPAFATPDEMTASFSAQAPRCLTPDQRRAVFLPETPPDECLVRELWPYSSDDWQEWRRRSLAGLSPAMPHARGRLGFTGQTLTPELAAKNRLRLTRGALVTDIFLSHAADRAGIKAGDVIVMIGEREVSTMEDVAAEVSWAGEGKTIGIGIVRNGIGRTISARLDAYYDPVKLAGGAVGGIDANEPYLEKMRKQAFTPEGLVEAESKRIDELNLTSLEAGNRGDFAEAIRGRELMISRISYFRSRMVRNQQPDERKEAEVIDGVLFADIAWFAVLAGQKERALREAMKSRGLVGTKNSALMNIAHALLVNDRFEEARAIYMAHRGEKLDDGRSWETVVLADLKEMKQHGVPSLLIDTLAADMSTGVEQGR